MRQERAAPVPLQCRATAASRGSLTSDLAPHALVGGELSGRSNQQAQHGCKQIGAVNEWLSE